MRNIKYFVDFCIYPCFQVGFSYVLTPLQMSRSKVMFWIYEHKTVNIIDNDTCNEVEILRKPNQKHLYI